MKADKQSFKTGSAVNLSTSALNITGLLGDTYDYTIIARFTNASADSILDITLNSDTTANYRNYEMKGLSSTVSAAVGDSDTAIELQNIIGTANPGLLIMSITGSSGDERYINCEYSGDGAILKQSSYWKNTADEVDEITFTAASSVTCDYEITIYRIPKEASQEKWELVESKTFTSSSSDQVFTVDGDSDIQYRLEVISSSALWMRLNNDTAGNYTDQRLYNAGGSIGATPVAGNTLFNLYEKEASIIINAESGVKRLCTRSSRQTSANQQEEVAGWWNNTADNLTEIRLLNLSSSTGTAKLYRRRNPNTIGETLPFEMVEEVAVSGNFSAGHTFSGLSGDDVLLYKLEWVGEADNSGLWYMQINGDTTSNYTRQFLSSSSSSVSAGAQTLTGFPIMDASASGSTCDFEVYLYPKSGENRSGLNRTSSPNSTNFVFNALWWGNSADEIDEIKVFASSTPPATGTLKLSRIMRSDVSRLFNTFGFNGSSKYINVPDSSSLDLGTNDFTISFWIKRNSINVRQYIVTDNKQTADFDGFYIHFTSSNVLQLFLKYPDGTQHNCDSGVITNTSDFHHIFISVDRGGDMVLYIDGAVIDTVDISSKSTENLDNAAILSIGRREQGLNDLYLNADMTNYQMFDAAYNSSDATYFYNNGIVRAFDTLPAPYSSDCMISLQMSSNDNSLVDETINGNDGTAFGSVTSDGDEIKYRA